MNSIVSRVAPAVDNRIERKILIGLVTNDTFCRLIQPLWKDEAFKFPYAKIIGKWCREYFDKYGKAPGKNIEDLFCEARPFLSPEDSKMIANFLSDISDEYSHSECFNTDYILDSAEEYFRLSAIDNLKKDISDCIVSGRIEDAEALIAQYVRPSRPQNRGINPIIDIEGIIDAYRATETNKILQLPGELGKLVTKFNRGELIAIVGPSGIGKTWWMISIGLLAALRGYNVAFFSYEMPRDQIVRRVQQIMTGLPKKDDNYDGKIYLPVWDCLLNQNGSCDDPRRANKIPLNIKKTGYKDVPIGYKPCAICKGEKSWYPASWLKEEMRPPITEEDIIAKHRAIMASHKNGIGDFHVMSAPSGRMSVADVRIYLKNREYYENIVTDFVITDSADKMKPELFGGNEEHRHGIYGIWMAHKALAEELHATVLTASHSNTERSGKRIRQGDWAEDIRKLRESDIAFALNQTPTMKLLGQYSVSMMKIRDAEFHLEKSVMVLSCLKIGRPFLDSAVERTLPKDSDPDDILGKKIKNKK